jgi:hypothetical protein
LLEISSFVRLTLSFSVDYGTIIVLPMRRVFTLLLSTLLLSCAAQPKWKCEGVTSPDQQLRACITSFGNPAPLNESVVQIHDINDRVLATDDFRSSTGSNGRNVQKNQWTPDSQFFVFSTASSGGHSPWHWQTYFYSRQSNSFKELDNFTGPIIKSDFTISAPDWIEVTVQGTRSDPSDIVTGHKVKRRLSALH